MNQRLIVFEGPDNVGKTTICKNLSDKLQTSGINCVALSFPGNKKGTLGRFIHDFHHNHDKYNIKKLSNVSLQLLHVAAHFDTINKYILPAIKQNDIVLLDRFWWSTFVYGKIGGIREDILNKILEIEDLAWGKLVPDIVFLIDNKEPVKDSKTKKWIKLRNEYQKLANLQSENHKIIQITNDKPIEEITQKIIGILDFNIKQSRNL